LSREAHAVEVRAWYALRRCYSSQSRKRTVPFGGRPGNIVKDGRLVFHPLSIDELSQKPTDNLGGFGMVHLGLEPRHRSYLCGACGQTTTGRVVCSLLRDCDKATVLWCLCACEKNEPTIVTEKDSVSLSQFPLAREFVASQEWPQELADLFDEGARAYAGSAFTATSMVCRKVLMACACHEQQKSGTAPEEGKPFKYYVDYIAEKVLTYPSAKTAIDAIREIGNDANHHLQFVAQADAKRSLKIVQRLLDAIYALPAA